MKGIALLVFLSLFSSAEDKKCWNNKSSPDFQDKDLWILKDTGFVYNTLIQLPVQPYSVFSCDDNNSSYASAGLEIQLTEKVRFKEWIQYGDRIMVELTIDSQVYIVRRELLGIYKLDVTLDAGTDAIFFLFFDDEVRKKAFEAWQDKDLLLGVLYNKYFDKKSFEKSVTKIKDSLLEDITYKLYNVKNYIIISRTSSEYLKN